MRTQSTAVIEMCLPRLRYAKDHYCTVLWASGTTMSALVPSLDSLEATLAALFGVGSPAPQM